MWPMGLLILREKSHWLSSKVHVWTIYKLSTMWNVHSHLRVVETISSLWEGSEVCLQSKASGFPSKRRFLVRSSYTHLLCMLIWCSNTLAVSSKLVVCHTRHLVINSLQWRPRRGGSGYGQLWFYWYSWLMTLKAGDTLNVVAMADCSEEDNSTHTGVPGETEVYFS